MGRMLLFLWFLFVSPGLAVSAVVQVEQSDQGWQLMVDGQPYFIKGFVYSPVLIGQSPHEATAQDWMRVDGNGDGKNDFAYETWIDVNANNVRDDDELRIGDFQILKEMHVNTLRFYHVASVDPVLGDLYQRDPSTRLQFDHAPDKALLRELYEHYGIRVIIGNFLGSWTIGSGAAWDEGTDYTNPVHVENIVNSVIAMVNDHKDEDYVLMWMLGNENNIADWSRMNAHEHPEAYAKLVGRLARLIKELDPGRPVAVCEGDKFNILTFYPEHAPEIDIVAFNAYRSGGFGRLWEDVKEIFDRPVMISEFGKPAYGGAMGEELQFDFVRAAWVDIEKNRAGGSGAGNAIGGTVYDFVDRWYMDGTPWEQNGVKEEYFGVMSLGDGSDPYIRQTRKAARYLKQAWTEI